MEPPKPSVRDHVEAGLRAAAGPAIDALGVAAGIPEGALSGALAVLLDAIPSRFQTEHRRFLIHLAADVEKLRRRMDWQEHEMNERVLADTLVQVLPVVTRHMNAAKCEWLRNAVNNATLPGAPAEAHRRMFIRLVDELDELHVRLLGFLSDPRRYLEANRLVLPENSGRGMLFEESTAEARLELVLPMAFPGFEFRFLWLLIAELDRRGLVRDVDSHGREQRLTATTNVRVAVNNGRSLTTQLADQFLRFIGDTPAPGD